MLGNHLKRFLYGLPTNISHSTITGAGKIGTRFRNHGFLTGKLSLAYEIYNKCYKINLQESVAFLYTDNKLSERKIKKIPFTIVSKGKKYLGTNLNQEGKRLIH